MSQKADERKIDEPRAKIPKGVVDGRDGHDGDTGFTEIADCGKKLLECGGVKERIGTEDNFGKQLVGENGGGVIGVGVAESTG